MVDSRDVVTVVDQIEKGCGGRKYQGQKKEAKKREHPSAAIRRRLPPAAVG
jgi:hypothetical protein